MASTRSNNKSLVAVSKRPDLLTTPPEIRNYIFTLALVEDAPITAKAAFNDIHSGYLSHPRPPALAHVSRQLRREALSIFYGHNVFSIRSPRNNNQLLGHEDNASPFKWRLGLLNYGTDIPKHVRKLLVESERKVLGVSNIVRNSVHIKFNLVQHSDGDITMMIQYKELSDNSPKKNRLCMCHFEEAVPSAVLEWDVSGEDQLFKLAECLYREPSVRGTWTWPKRTECGDKCEKSGVKNMSVLVPGRE